MGGYVGNAPDQTANLYDERYAPIGRSRKNLLINGSCTIWQRGTSGPLPLNAFTYMADRWVADCYGAALTWATGNTPASPNYNPGSLVISGAAGNTGFSVHQRIEAANVFHTYGKRLTVSGWMYLTGAARNITPQLYRPNTKNAFSSLTLVDGGTTIAHPGGGAWIQFKHTFANTMPLEVANGLTLLFSSPAHGAGLNFALADVQLEVGEEATEFDRVTTSQELSDCQRYYQKVAKMIVDAYSDITYAPSASSAIPFPVTMRAAPSISFANITKDNSNDPVAAGVTSSGLAMQRAVIATGRGYVFADVLADAEL